MPYVNGVWMDAPGVAVSINDSNFQAPPSVGGLGVLVIGSTDDGEPNTPISFSTPASATTALKGGDGLQAVLNVFSGAQFVGGSVNVTFIRPEQATQATSSINAPGGSEQIGLKSTSYGLPGNSSKWMVQSATNGYTISQATDYVGAGGQTFPAGTPTTVSLPVITLAYTGSGTNPVATITDAEFTVSATVDGSLTAIAQISLGSTVTAQQLVNQLNQVADLVATVADPNPSDATGALFDNVSDVAVSTTSTAPTTFYANVTAAVRYFNSANLYFTAVRQANATSLATSNTWTYATGGTAPSATNSDWQNAYTTAQGVTGITLIGPASSSESMWAMNDAHCSYMNSLGQRRCGYLGDESGQTLTTELAQVQTLNSQFSSLVWPEQQGIDYNGESTTFAPYLYAFVVMGERAATVPYDALTQQATMSDGMGQTVTPGMVSQGLAGGLCMIAPNSAGTVVVQQDRTTWLQNTAYDKVENSTAIVTGIITASLLAVLQPFIGKPVTPVQVGAAQTAVLNDLINWYNQGYLATMPVPSDVSLQGSGDTITGTAQAAIDVPTNYIVLQLIPTAVNTAA